MAVLGGFSLEKALLLFGLIWFHLLQPGEGKLKWWRVRYWDGKYWYVWADGGFWEPLTDSEYLSLRKAMRKDATIGDYIHDESRIGEKIGCWDVSDWRPIFLIPPPAWRRLMVFLIPLPAWTRLMVLIPLPAWRRLTLVQEEGMLSAWRRQEGEGGGMG